MQRAWAFRRGLLRRLDRPGGDPGLLPRAGHQRAHQPVRDLPLRPDGGRAGACLRRQLPRRRRARPHHRGRDGTAVRSGGRRRPCRPPLRAGGVPGGAGAAGGGALPADEGGILRRGHLPPPAGDLPADAGNRAALPGERALRRADLRRLRHAQRRRRGDFAGGGVRDAGYRPLDARLRYVPPGVGNGAEVRAPCAAGSCFSTAAAACCRT